MCLFYPYIGIFKTGFGFLQKNWFKKIISFPNQFGVSKFWVQKNRCRGNGK